MSIYDFQCHNEKCSKKGEMVEKIVRQPDVIVFCEECGCQMKRVEVSPDMHAPKLRLKGEGWTPLYNIKMS